MAEDIKKTFIFKEELNKVDKNNNHHIRFRIVTDDLSRTSAWSTFYELPATDLVPVTGTAVGLSTSIVFAWEDSNGRPEYDVFVAEGRSIASRSLTNNIATIITSNAHGLSQGNVVTVQGTGSTTIDGTGLPILSVPNTTAFTYSKTGANVANGTATAGAAVYLEFNNPSTTMDMYRYHGTSPIHTYSIVRSPEVNRVKFIVQVASYEKELSPTIEIYPRLTPRTYTESFAIV